MVVQSHGRLHLVDVLATRAARTVSVPADVGGIDFNLHVVVDDRVGIDRGERGVAAVGRVEGRQTHQPVHTVLALQIAVAVRAVQFDGSRLDACHIAFLSVNQGDVVFVALAPTRVHTEQHLCPVAAFGAAGARVDGQDHTEAVLFIAHHIAELELFYQADSVLVCLVGLLFRGLFGLEEFEDDRQLVETVSDFVIFLYPRLDETDLLEQLFGCLGVVPEIGLMSDFLFGLDFFYLLVDVKETSLAHRVSLKGP